MPPLLLWAGIAALFGIALAAGSEEEPARSAAPSPPHVDPPGDRPSPDPATMTTEPRPPGAEPGDEKSDDPEEEGE